MSIRPFFRICTGKLLSPRLVTSPLQVRKLSTSKCMLSSGPQFKTILQQNDLSDETKKDIETDVKDMLKDWLPYGWDDNDKINDTAQYKTLMYVSMVFLTFGFAFQMWYKPRGIEGDWARREAFLELERRRKLGLPLVDPNIIPPERVRLPSKEELGPDFKITI